MLGKFVDLVLEIIKWPLAVFLLLSLPALLQSYNYFDYGSVHFRAFGAGAVLYLATIVMAGHNISRTMQIISHELTHVVFALLTFHDGGRIRVNPDDSGGEMQVWGGGNWLICLAPYFFPLFSFLYMLLMHGLIVVSGGHYLVYGIFGYFFGYYWGTVLSQVHPQQTDIKKAGYLFSTIFIIGANLYTTGIIFAFNNRQWDGVAIYLELVWKLDLQSWGRVIKLIL